MRTKTSDTNGRRVLTLTPATAVVISSMIGTGIFTTSGLMIGMGARGGDILVGWLLGGVIALCGALCYGEMGAAMPQSGGEYYFLSRLLHPALGFMSGCVSMVVGFAAPVAASAMAMHLFLAHIVSGWPVRTLAVATILIISLLHAYDVRLAGRVQVGLIALKVLLLVAFVSFILPNPRPGALDTLTEFDPFFWASPSFAVILIFVSFAYSGWNAAVYVGSEMRQPGRTLPHSLLLGTALVTLLYLLTNVAFMSAMPVAELAGVTEMAHVVGERRWGNGGARMVSLLIALTQIVPISAMLMIGPRVVEAMARDQVMPTGFAKLNGRKVPVYAVMLQAALASLFVITSSFGALLIYIGFTLNIFAALTVFCLFRLRRMGGDHPKVCIGYPITPLVFLSFSLFITVWSIWSQPAIAIVGFGTLLASYLVYVFQARRIQYTQSRDVATQRAECPGPPAVARLRSLHSQQPLS